MTKPCLYSKAKARSPRSFPPAKLSIYQSPSGNLQFLSRRSFALGVPSGALRIHAWRADSDGTMDDSVRDKDAISELTFRLRAGLKGSEYRVGTTVDFVAGAILVVAPDAWVLNAAEWRRAIRDDEYPAG